MIIDNLIRLILVSFSYIILIFGLSYIMMERVIKVKSFIDKFLLYFIVGNFYVINIIYILLFFKLTLRAVTVGVLLVGAIIIRYLLDKSTFKKAVISKVKIFALLSKGAYGWKLFWMERVNYLWQRTKDVIIYPIRHNFIEIIFFIMCIGIHIYYIGYRFIYYSGFGISDEPVHLEWVQYMLQGEIFSNGAYPFGMHNIIYAVIKVFGFNAFTVTRNFGFIIAILMAIFLYIILKKVCRSKYAPIIGLFLYVAANLYWDYVWDRTQYAIPEQFGILFLYPMCIYLYYYLNYKQFKHLLLFGLCFSLTLFVHYYVSIVALVLCLCVGLSKVYTIFKEKLIIKILLFGLLSTIVGIVPIGVGIATGHGIDGSLYWGISVINGTVDQYEDDETPIADEEEQPEEITPTQKINKVVHDTIANAMHQEVFWAIIITMFLILINTLLQNLMNKARKETFLQLSIVLYVSILIILLNSNGLGLPVLIQDYRVRVYLAYAVPILLSMPFEIIYEWIDTGKNSNKIVDFITVVVIIIIVSGVYYRDYTRVFSRFTLLQSDSAVEVTYKIFNEFDNHNWTIVSTVDEYSVVLDEGYHYELIDLLAELENYNKKSSITIPTKDIFFFIEKRPINRDALININKGVPSYEKFKEKDAQTQITEAYVNQPSLYYTQERRPIMAKTYYWAVQYKEYFPNEMTLYYEDEDFICYRLEQEPYHLNNLAIDYGYNTNLQNIGEE